MNWELDHVFFATTNPEGAERAFERLGIAFGRRRVHPGQGTANACADFENAYFEILSARDWGELRSDLVRPLGLDERIRWRETGACPFGLCFRPAAAAHDVASPFGTWAYAARYLPAGTSIAIVTPRGSFSEPMVFISGNLEPAWRTKPTGLRRRLTRIRVRRPASAAPLSSGVRWFSDLGLVAFEDGDDHELELAWDGGLEAQIPRLAREIPIALRW